MSETKWHLERLKALINADRRVIQCSRERHTFVQTYGPGYRLKIFETGINSKPGFLYFDEYAMSGTTAISSVFRQY